MQGNVHGGKQLGGKDGKRVTVIVSAAMQQKLFALAKRQERTISDIVRDVLKEYLAKNEG